ncbi:hypothetical protein GOV11_01695 [Candidatus Woesearchaeota archaeon]|nr:hypothetical protein [Candidatus Woesearchaeota archaeon]
MIDTKDQEDLFKLISRYLKKDVTCYAIGGTAMMFYGYKTTTKDIDLVFPNKKYRDEFIRAIRELGYKEQSLKTIYDERRRARRDRPLIYTRGDERFDLFIGCVFGFVLPEDMEIVQRHDFPEHLTLQILPVEYLVLLKAITRRATDHEDILTILKVEKTLDWDSIIDYAISQKKQNPWILVDLEETLQKLKKVTFIKDKHFKKIYSEQ